MGGAMLAGWLAEGLSPKRVGIVEPAFAAGTVALPHRDFVAVAEPQSLPADFRPDVIVLAVKPQVMAWVAPDYRRYAVPETVFLSIAAGQTLAGLAAHLGDGAAIVRIMPNTPAAVGRGITVGCANPNVSEAQRQLCEQLMSAVGEVDWVEDEGLLDAVTGVSGSGPAYVFALIECLAVAGIEAGLPEDLAMKLARATVTGAGELVHVTGEHPAVLRQNVTSPMGTTAAALDVLLAEDALQPLITRTVAAATRRSRELAE
ncbi:MAG: pyrroline-5-carboxylate reductase [Alphaproteobacteria bacterium]|nr:pyrroline-5-carboxylate reductase [Alphaproteobacteria bacterium]